MLAKLSKNVEEKMLTLPKNVGNSCGKYWRKNVVNTSEKCWKNVGTTSKKCWREKYLQYFQ
jgi:hypothetical protein